MDKHIKILFISRSDKDWITNAIALCKEIRIPESMKFMLVKSGILCFGIQNPESRFHWQRLTPVPGIRNPQPGIQNPRLSYIPLHGAKRTFKFYDPLSNRPIRLTRCCTQFKSPGDKILYVLSLHYNVAFTFKWYGNSWNKRFYSQRVWTGYNIS